MFTSIYWNELRSNDRFGINKPLAQFVCSIVIACKFVEHFTSEEDATPTSQPLSALLEPMQVDTAAKIIQLTPEQWTEHLDALNDHRSALNEQRTLINELRLEIYTLQQEVQTLEKQVKSLEQQLDL